MSNSITNVPTNSSRNRAHTLVDALSSAPPQAPASTTQPPVSKSQKTVNERRAEVDPMDDRVKITATQIGHLRTIFGNKPGDKKMPSLKTPNKDDDDVKHWHDDGVNLAIPKTVAIETPHKLWADDDGRRTLVAELRRTDHAADSVFARIELGDRRELATTLEQIDAFKAKLLEWREKRAKVGSGHLRDELKTGKHDYGLDLVLNEATVANLENGHNYVDAFTKPRDDKATDPDSSAIRTMRLHLATYAAAFRLGACDEAVQASDAELFRKLSTLRPRVLAARMRGAEQSSVLLEPWDGRESSIDLDLDDDPDNCRPCDDLMRFVTAEDLGPEHQRLDGAEDDAPLTMDWEDMQARGLNASTTGKVRIENPKFKANGQALAWCKCACCSEANPLGLDEAEEEAPAPAPKPKAKDAAAEERRRFLEHPECAHIARALAERGPGAEKEAAAGAEVEDKVGFEVATPYEVWTAQMRCYAKSSRDRDHPLCLMKMASIMIRAGLTQELSSMLTCCTSTRCLEKMGMRAPDWTTRWELGGSLKTLENGSRRHGQDVDVNDNLFLLRYLFVNRWPNGKEPLLDEPDGAALLGFFNGHSQWVQEREKKTCTAAVTLAKAPEAFTFVDPNGFVKTAHDAVFNYLPRVVGKHVFDTQSGFKNSPKQQESGSLKHTLHQNDRWSNYLTKLVDTGMPRHFEYCYVLMKRQVLLARGIGYQPWWFESRGLWQRPQALGDGTFGTYKADADAFVEGGVCLSLEEWEEQKLVHESVFLKSSTLAPTHEERLQWFHCKWRGRLGLRGAPGPDPFSIDDFHEAWTKASGGGLIKESFEPEYMASESWRSDDFASIRNALGGGLADWQVHDLHRTLCGGGNVRKRIGSTATLNTDEQSRTRTMDGAHQIDGNTYPFIRMNGVLTAIGGVGGAEFKTFKERQQTRVDDYAADMKRIQEDPCLLWKHLFVEMGDGLDRLRVTKAMREHLATTLMDGIAARRQAMRDDEHSLTPQTLEDIDAKIAVATDKMRAAWEAAAKQNRVRERQDDLFAQRQKQEIVDKFADLRADLVHGDSNGPTAEQVRTEIEDLRREQARLRSHRKSMEAANRMSSEVEAAAATARQLSRLHLERRAFLTRHMGAEMEAIDAFWVDKMVELIVRDLETSPEDASKGMRCLSIAVAPDGTEDVSDTMCVASFEAPYDDDPKKGSRLVPSFLGIDSVDDALLRMARAKRAEDLKAIKRIPVLRVEDTVDVASRYGRGDRMPEWDAGAVVFNNVGVAVRQMLAAFIMPTSTAYDETAVSRGADCDSVRLYDRERFDRHMPMRSVKVFQRRVDAETNEAICVPDWTNAMLDFVPSGTLGLAAKTAQRRVKVSPVDGADADDTLLVGGKSSPNTDATASNRQVVRGKNPGLSDEEIEARYARLGGDHLKWYKRFWGTVCGDRAMHRARCFGADVASAPASASAPVHPQAPNRQCPEITVGLAASGATRDVVMGELLGHERGVDEGEARGVGPEPSLLGMPANHVVETQPDGSTLRVYDASREFASEAEKLHYQQLHDRVGGMAMTMLKSMLGRSATPGDYSVAIRRTDAKIGLIEGTIATLNACEDSPTPTVRQKLLALRLGLMQSLRRAHGTIHQFFLDFSSDLSVFDDEIEPDSELYLRVVELYEAAEVVLSASGRPSTIVHSASWRPRDAHVSWLGGQAPNTAGNDHLWTLQCVRDDLQGVVRDVHGREVVAVQDYNAARPSLLDVPRWELVQFCNLMWTFQHPARHPLFERMALRKAWGETSAAVDALGDRLRSVHMLDALEKVQEHRSDIAVEAEVQKAQEAGLTDDDVDGIRLEHQQVPVMNTFLAGEDGEKQREWAGAVEDEEEGLRPLFAPELRQTTPTQQMMVGYARYKSAKADIVYTRQKRDLAALRLSIEGGYDADEQERVDRWNGRTERQVLADHPELAESGDRGEEEGPSKRRRGAAPRAPTRRVKGDLARQEAIESAMLEQKTAREGGDEDAIAAADERVERAKKSAKKHEGIKVGSELVAKQAKRLNGDPKTTSTDEPMLQGHLGILQSLGKLAPEQVALDAKVRIEQQHVDALAEYVSSRETRAKRKRDAVCTAYTKFARTITDANTAEARKTRRDNDPAVVSPELSIESGVPESTFEDYLEVNLSTAGRQHNHAKRLLVDWQSAEDGEGLSSLYARERAERRLPLDAQAIIHSQRLELEELGKFRSEQGVAWADDHPALRVDHKKENKARMIGR